MSKKTRRHELKRKARCAYQLYTFLRRHAHRPVSREDLEHCVGLSRAQADALYRHIVEAEKLPETVRYDAWDQGIHLPDLAETDFVRVLLGAESNG